MGTFNGAVLTATGANGYTTDNAPINFGLLNPKAMTAPTALAGTTGTECSLVHGDIWNQIEQNHTRNVLGWRHLTVSGDEIHKILTNLVHRVNGTTNDTRVGVHNQTNIAPRNDEFMHTRTEIHHQKEHREQKTEDEEFSEKLIEFKKEHFEHNWLKMDIKELAFDIGTVMAFEKKMFAVGNKIFAMEGDAIDVEFKEIKTSLGALGSEIKAGKFKVAGTHIKAIAGNINAGIALNADSPFG